MKIKIVSNIILTSAMLLPLSGLAQMQGMPYGQEQQKPQYQQQDYMQDQLPRGRDPKQMQDGSAQGQGMQDQRMMMPTDQQKERKLPKNISEECKTSLQTMMDQHDASLGEKKQANKSQVSALQKEKRKAIRAQEDKFTTSRRALEDAFDETMSGDLTAADRKKAENAFKKSMNTLNQENNKAIKQIETDYKKKTQEFLGSPAMEKSELPSECSQDSKQLKKNPEVKGIFIIK